ncbi:MAG: N-acetylmuramoyl-L-alanine amidase, partial [Pseudomonadota bacterium]
VRIHEAPDHTRVVLDVSAPQAYELAVYKNPHRISIDLPNARLGPHFNADEAAGRTRIKRLRTAQRDTGQRLVLDVNGALTPKAFALKPVAPYGHRLVIDLFSSADGRVAAQPIRRRPPPQAPNTRRNVRVVIDAGHGGEDPGALGPNGAQEKDVVLAVARALRDRINRRSGYEAKLVRDGDYYVSLGERTARARAAKADLFLSLHADAFKQSNVRGASVYTLSSKGASSEAARWLAEKENRSDLIGGVGTIALREQPDLVQQVLIDMSTHANRALSNAAGRVVLGELESLTRLHKVGVEHANFMVLRAPDVPSMLIEMGFISNPTEARQLASKRHQLRLAEAIDRAVAAYFAETPPPGTLLAARAALPERKHVIRRGDTLSELAVRYGVAARRIREVNGLASDAIRIGQTLIIPVGS